MKPNFALSLSVKGIQLLHRATGGWRLVGEVSLNSKDMKSDLSKLKQKAEKLGAGPIRTKLIIPDDQIKYLELDSGSGDADARRQQARSALDGATPYVLSDLEFDIALDGKTTHVAAVARETLDEAEAFAVDHGFGPISFVAAPDADTTPYLGEPFFGTTRWVTNILSKGDTVVQDGIAVVNIGPVEAEKKEKPAKEDAKPAEPVVAPALKSATDASPKADTSFASVRGSRGTDDAEKPAPKPRKVDDGMAASSIPIPKLTPAVEPGLTPPKPRFTITPGEDGIVDKKPVLNGSADKKPALNGAAAPDKTDLPPRVAAALAAKEKPDLTAPKRVNGAAPVPTNAKATQINAIKPSKAKVDADAERRNLTIFGERETDTKVVGGKPKYLGLGLTAGLVLFIGAVALWSGLWFDDSTSTTAAPAISNSDPQPQPVQTEDPTPVVAAIEAPQPIEVPDSDTTAALDLDPVTPSVDPEVAQDPVVEPETAAPEIAADPVVEPVVAPATDTVVETAAPAPETTTGLTDTDTAVLDALRNSAPTEPLTLESAQTAYSVTGIWQMPPDGGIEQGRVDINDVYVASIDTNTVTPDLFSLPPVDTFGTDTALEPIALPPPAGLSFKLDDRGLVIASPEGTLSPEGILIYSGRPLKVPPPTPERAASVAPDVPAAEQSFAPQSPDIRPRIRPADLVEQNERGQLGGFSRTELASLRPRLRPLIDTSDAVADVLAEVQEEATAEIENATELAVVLSPAPSPRPNNIAAIVQRAQDAQPAAAASTAAPSSTATVTQVAAVAPRTVTPKIPTSTSVAKAATVKNSLNLRQVNLMGVAGKPSARRALVRMPNGRIATVKVGDRIDGGRVVAIGEGELRYKKGSRNLVLKMPKG